MTTSRQQMLIRESFAAAKELADPLARLFFGRLFQISPEVRPLFRSDMNAQGKKLMDLLELVVGSVGHLDPLRPRLRELGARHVGYGVEPHQYEAVSAALIWAIGQASVLTMESREAWRVLLNEISAEMLSSSPAHDTTRGQPR
jgi:nitric oxide dioxygenase